jgi:hypothetical protein
MFFFHHSCVDGHALDRVFGNLSGFLFVPHCLGQQPFDIFLAKLLSPTAQQRRGNRRLMLDESFPLK